MILLFIKKERIQSNLKGHIRHCASKFEELILMFIMRKKTYVMSHYKNLKERQSTEALRESKQT